MADHIRVACPKCGASLKIRVAYAGRRGSCKHCGGIFTIPSGQEKETPAATAESRHGTGTDLWEPKPSTDPEQNLKAEVERLKRYITSITREREALRGDAVLVRAELVHASQTIAHLETVEGDLASSRVAAEEARARADQLATELEQSKAEVDRLNNELNRNRTEFDAAIDAWERRHDASRTEHESKHHEVATLSDSHRLEAETWKTRHDDARQAHDESTREFEENIDAVRAERDRLTSHNASLKSQQDTTESRHQMEFSETRTEKEALERELATHSERVNDLEHRLEEEANLRACSERATEELRVTLANLADLPRENVETIQGLEERLRHRTEEVHESNRHRAELENELSRKKAESEEFQNQISRAHEFKLQIRSLLSPLGINLPDA